MSVRCADFVDCMSYPSWLAGDFLVESFRELHGSNQWRANKELSSRRIAVPAPPLQSLLDVRQTLASFRQMLQEQSPDRADLLFQVDTQILQVDELHRSLTSDTHTFQHRSSVTEAGKAAKRGRKQEYSTKAIVTAVQACTLLRDSADLEKQMRHSLQLLLPNQSTELSAAIDRGLIKAPGPSQISRWRLAVDVGFMFVMRSLFRETRGRAVRCFLVDSSPQRGFDWVLSEAHSLSPSDFSQWVQNQWRMIETRSHFQRLTVACESAAGRAQDHDLLDLQEQLRQVQQGREDVQRILDSLGSVRHPTVDIHLCPPSAQGSQRAQLVHKVHALLHTLRLEVGEWHEVAEYLSTVRAVTTDFGTESGLCDVENVDISLLFPWAQNALDFERAPAPACEDEDVALQGNACLVNGTPFLQVREGKIVMPKLFPLAVQVPGALHILHHSVEELTSAFDAYESWFLPGLKAVNKVFSKKHVRERFIAEILRGSEASSFETAVQQLQLNLHEARWGTLITTCKELLSIRLVFVYWDLSKVLGGAPGPDATDEDRDSFADGSKMSEAVSSPCWWEYLCMIIRLGRVVDHLEHWFEACPCHYRTVPESASLSGNTIFRTRYSCPLAGRRAPELAAGALDDVVQQTLQTQHAELLMACSSLPSEDRDTVLKDYASAQAKLENYLAIKFAFWKALPHCLLVLGHHSEHVARSSLTQAKQLYDERRDSDKHHALTKHFFESDFSVQLDAFLSGSTSRCDSCDLAREAAAAAFVSCVERSIEARHALLKAKTALMKKMLPSTFSVAVRSHEFNRRCFQDLPLLEEWQRHVKRLKVNPRKGLPHVLLHLGMSCHPDVVRLASLDSKVKLRHASNIVYHCDLETQYDKRAEAARALKQPQYRSNPDAAPKLRQLVSQQATEEEKQSMMLRILMQEHFRRHCQEGQIYSVTGTLPPTRSVLQALLPRADASAAVAEHVPQQMFSAPDPEPHVLQVGQPEPRDDLNPLAMAEIAEPNEPTVFVQAGHRVA